MANYLVTGAEGFIGSALAEKLIAENHKVVTVDNLSTGDFKNIPDQCEYIIGDLSEKDIINKLNKYEFDAIFHIAGQSGGMKSFEDPIYDMNSNIASTILLLEYCRRNNCNKFIYASSMSVYGQKNECPINETDDLDPTSFYAVGKMASEKYMNIYSEEYDIYTIALRLNNVYGPGQNMSNLKQGMVSIFLSQAIDDKHIHVLGEKDRFRDFVYIDDIVNAFILSANSNLKKNNNVFNVSTNIKTTVEQLVNIIIKKLPYEISVEYKGRTPGDQFGVFCEYQKINNSLGWHPNVKLDVGLENMINWALNLNNLS